MGEMADYVLDQIIDMEALYADHEKGLCGPYCVFCLEELNGDEG